MPLVAHLTVRRPAPYDRCPLDVRSRRMPARLWRPRRCVQRGYLPSPLRKRKARMISDGYGPPAPRNAHEGGCARVRGRVRSLIAAIALVLPLSAAAQETGDIAALPGADPVLHDVRFTGSLMGIPIGRAESVLAMEPDRYAAEVRMAATGVVRLFTDWQLSAEASGALAPDGDDLRLVPARHSRTSYRDGGEGEDHITLTFDGGLPQVVEARPHPSEEDRDPVSEADRAGALDPLSAILALSRSVGRSGGCDALVPAFDGRARYDLSLHPIDYDGMDFDRAVDLAGYALGGVGCMFRLRGVAGIKRKYMERDDPRAAEGYVFFRRVAEGLPPLPARIQVETRVGTAVVRLDEARPRR